jgi:hypothetical protein
MPEDCCTWLLETRRWTSQLHHLELLPTARVRALVTAGTDLHARDGLDADAPSPLSLARQLLVRDAAHENAQLVVDAAAPWSPHNHALFPKAARARAIELLLLGCLVAREQRFACCETALIDVWRQHVMAHAVTRQLLSAN